MNSFYKRNTITILTLVCFIFILTSCKKSSWYDVKPYKFLKVPETLDDMQAIMDNAELLNRNTPAIGEAGSDGHFVDNVSFSAMDPMTQNTYNWTHTVRYEKIREWNETNDKGAYPKIYSCDLVIEGLNKIVPASVNEQLQWNTLKGQALFHRAKALYELSQVFAPAFNNTTASSDPSIPLRLEADITARSNRSTVKETYDQIINDLLLAKQLLPQNILPESKIYKARPTRATAFGLLARIYLSMEDYPNALKNSDSCLALYSSLLDFNDISSSSSIPFQVLNAEVIMHSSMSTQFYGALSPPYVSVDTALYNSYATNDLRKSTFFDYDAGTGQVSFKGSYVADGSTLFSGIATDEIYLIRAECSARAGNTTAAMKDLNDLLRTRWKKISGVTTYVDQVATDPTDALGKILLERKKELLLRGLRWSDLRRLNRDDRFKITIKRITSSGIFTLEPNSFKYTYPLPDDVIDFTGMQQNQGW